MRFLISLLVIVAIGLGIGSASAWYSLQQSHGIGAINIGQWSAWPFIGGSSIDPYTGARVVTDGSIPLGAAEGLSFEASTDEDGTPLRLECRYRLEGQTPPSRLWTLVAYDEQGRMPASSSGGLPHKYSGNTIRFPDGTFIITISDTPTSGNWISIRGTGAMKLILRLYDTPVTSTSGIIEPTMPKIINLGCRS